MADQPRSPAYRVGEPFLPGRASWPAGAQYGHGIWGHELTIFQGDPAPEFQDAVARGEAEFALTVAGPIFFLAYRFGKDGEWHDVPYSWHLQHPESRRRPSSCGSPERRALLWVSLVRANDGLVLAQRGLTLSPEFTRALSDAIRGQADAPFDPLECSLCMAEVSGESPSATLRLERATVWTRGNA